MLGWIAAGELRAMNVAAKPNALRPTWRVTAVGSESTNCTEWSTTATRTTEGKNMTATATVSKNDSTNAVARATASRDQLLASVQTAYTAIVRSSALGKAVDPDAVGAFLLTNRIASEKFAADVQRLARQYELRAVLDQRADREKRASQLASKISTAAAKYDALESQLANERFAAISPLEADASAADAAIRDCDEAHAALASTADPSVVAERIGVFIRLRRARLDLGVVRENIASTRNAVATHEAKIRFCDNPKAAMGLQLPSPQVLAQDRRKSVRLRDGFVAQGVAIEQSIPAAEAMVRRLEAELASLNAGLLDPSRDSCYLGSPPPIPVVPQDSNDFTIHGRPRGYQPATTFEHPLGSHEHAMSAWGR